MGLARKGKSRISVNGRDYRWVVSGNDGWLDLVLEHIEGHGQRLVVQFEYWVGSITPRLVRQVILKGIDAAWRPLSRDKSLCFRWSNSTLCHIDSA